MGILLVLMVVIYRRKNRLLNESDKKKQSEKLIILTDGNFKNTIQKGVVLIDFWAPWCRPCRIQNPIINELAEEYGDKVKICKMNVDENRQWAKKYNIMNIPNLLIFKDGKPVKQLIGVKPKYRIANTLKEVLEGKGKR